MSTSFKGFSIRLESVEWRKSFQKSFLLSRLRFFFLKEFCSHIQVFIGKVSRKIINLQIYWCLKLDGKGCSLLLLIP